jgi:hypothetical protein
MSVSNGQNANQTTFNNAFMSRTVNTSTVGVVGLNNTSNVNSGTAVTNLQRAINELEDTLGMAGEGDATRKNYSSNNVVANGDNRKVAIGKIDAKFDASTGHKHTGAAGDAPAIAAVDVVVAPVGNLTSTELQAALEELQGDIDALNIGLSNHLANTTDAHDASAISVVPGGSLVSTDVQAALEELQADIDGFSPGVTDHGALTGLSDDDHTQYALLAGRSGGQTLTGGTAASNNLVLRSSSNGTKGQIYLDETTASTSATTGALRVDGGVGIGGALNVAGAIKTLSSLILEDPGAGTNKITIQAPTLAGDYTLTLPVDDGTSGQTLTTDGAGVLSWATPSAGSIRATVHLYGGNGRGSVGTCVRRFTTSDVSAAGDIVYADSATNGMTVTIGSDGLYWIMYRDGSSGVGNDFAITRNSGSTNAGPLSLTYGSNVIENARSNVASTGYSQMCSVLIPLTAGDVIRAQCDTGMDATSEYSVHFRITKVAA